MSAKNIIQVDNPLLKKKNKIIKDCSSLKIKNLIKDLKSLMHKGKLVGISAPQIGQNYMVFITHIRNTKSRKIDKEDKLRVYVNPKITYFSKTQTTIYEGCGSVVSGDLFGPVLRSKEIEIKAFDENGKQFSLKCDGILARVIQHECDHLAGIEFIQRVSSRNDLVSGQFYRKFIKNSKKQTTASKTTKIEQKEF